MKKAALIFAMALTLIFTGCASKDIQPAQPPLDNIKSIEVYRYEGVPAAAEKKIVTEQSGIADVYELLISVGDPKKGEALSGGEVISFRVNLADGTKYEFIYSENSRENLEKVRDIWNGIPCQAAAAEMDELPILPALAPLLLVVPKGAVVCFS